MRSTEQILEQYYDSDDILLVEMIEAVKKEAWNESILLSAESATVTYTSDIAGRHYSVNKQSILKNLIP